MIDNSIKEYSNVPEDYELQIQLKLFDLLAKQTMCYTSGDSSSVPQSVAQELLNSICYLLKIDFDNPSPDLLNINFDSQLDLEIKNIEKKLDYFSRLWNVVCAGAQKINNISLRDTLKSMGRFRQNYHYRYFAHVVDCDIDYQLCQPVSEKLMGVDYVNRYLEQLYIENELLSRFDVTTEKALLRACYVDYIGLLVNLYEPVAVNALGLVLINGDVYGLNISDEERLSLYRLFNGCTKQQIKQLLYDGAEKLVKILNLKSGGALKYLRNLCIMLAPRILAVCGKGGLDGVFLTISAEKT